MQRLAPRSPCFTGTYSVRGVGDENSAKWFPLSISAPSVTRAQRFLMIFREGALQTHIARVRRWPCPARAPMRGPVRAVILRQEAQPHQKHATLPCCHGALQGFCLVWATTRGLNRQALSVLSIGTTSAAHSTEQWMPTQGVCHPKSFCVVAWVSCTLRGRQATFAWPGGRWVTQGGKHVRWNRHRSDSCKL